MLDKIAEIIQFAIRKIEDEKDWRPFEDLVLGKAFSHDGQIEFLSKSVSRENGLHPGNGWGKTSVLAKKHLKFILKHFTDGPKYKTLAVAITQD